MSEHTSNGSCCRRLKEPAPKPPLGRPHDAYATVFLVVFFAAAMFFTAYNRAEASWMGWVGMSGSLAALGVSFQYFIRSYGYANRGPIRIPLGAGFSAFVAFMFAGWIVAPALHAQLFGENLPALIVSYLVIAILTFAPMRIALGEAPDREDKATAKAARTR